MTDDTERFITAIRESIETALMDENCPVVDTFTTVRRVDDDGIYFIEGEIYTNALARAVHHAVIEHLSPPF